MDRFLRGMVLQTAIDGRLNPLLSPYRMATVVIRDVDVPAERWEQLATDEEVDDLNRLLATMVWYHSLTAFRDQETGWEEEDLARLVEPARVWLSALESRD